MADQFSLDVDPAVLQLAEKVLGEIGVQLEEEGAKLAGLPAQAGDLTGGTATVMKTAMAGIATDMRSGAPHLATAVTAIATFRRALEDAQLALASCNTSWAAAQSTYETAVTKADKAYDDAKASAPSGVWRADEPDLATARSAAKTTAAADVASSQRWIAYSWNATRQALDAQARACGAALENAVSRAVPPEVVRAYQTGGQSPGYGFDATAYLRGGSPFPSPVAPVVDALVARGVLPPTCRGMDATALAEFLMNNPEWAQKLMQNAPQMGDPSSAESRLAALFLPMVTNQGADVAEIRREAARSLFETFSPADQALLAMLFPSQVGNLGGAPFAARAAGNRVAVVAANADVTAQIKQLQAELATAQDALLPAGRGAYPVYQRMVALQDQIATLTAEQQTYQSVILDPRRQILLFDAANGRFAELTGTIGPDTRNVGVLVPGTTTNMGGINGNVATYGSFADQSAGSLAMITWMGGALPQSIAPEAFEASYSQALAPDLAAFTHEVRQEIEHSQAAGNAVQLTLAGHSYGGAVVGLSETYGSDADRVLHIESAGMGSGAYEPADLHPTNPDVRRYSMTAPGDLIGASQGLEVGPLGHGADPDTFPGTIRLETGYYADGSLVEGTDAHSGVFKPNSDSWAQINEVFNGGVVTTYGANEDPRILVTDGWGGAYWVDNPDYAPATHVDIP